MNFTWSFARRYSLTKQTNYENSEDLENCDKPDEFTTLVYEVMKLSSSYPTYRIHSSILQELMVRGFQLLCLWTQPLKERFKLINELKSATRPLSIADISTTSPSCTLRLSNLTIIGFPTQHGKLSTNPTNLRCPTNYKVRRYMRQHERNHPSRYTIKYYYFYFSTDVLRSGFAVDDDLRNLISQRHVHRFHVNVS